jgi:protein-ribulosamine 3-kinase
MSILDDIKHDITQQTATNFDGCQQSSIGGGCINSAYKLQAQEQTIFIKTNQKSLLHMFEAEAQGLQELGALNCVRVPNVICIGQTDGHSYLAMEYIELGSLRGQASALLGQQLAQLHRHQQSYFGWQIDNTIGSTPQHNDRNHNWVEFWQQQRLKKQLSFAAQNGFNGALQKQGQKLVDNIDVFFANYSPKASLLHGDLWGGNAAADDQGNPVIFDPACYYGDRETDIAMTELFGGFNNDFYAAYQAEYPLDSGYKTRKTLYNLYHILNHLNLFGGSYFSQAESMIGQLLAEI